MFTHTILTYISLNRVQVHTNNSCSTPRLSLNRVQFNMEWARNVLDLPGAMLGEFDVEAKHPFVIFMPEISCTYMGSTMCLGLRPTVFEEGSETWLKVWVLYGGAGKIWEQHQHQYKVNPAYVDRLQWSRLCFVGKDKKGEHMQVLELKSLHCIYSTQPTDTLAYTQTTPTLLVFKPTQNSACACYNHGTDSLHYAILISRTGLVIFLSTYLI